MRRLEPALHSNLAGDAPGLYRVVETFQPVDAKIIDRERPPEQSMRGRANNDLAGPRQLLQPGGQVRCFTAHRFRVPAAFTKKSVEEAKAWVDSQLITDDDLARGNTDAGFQGGILGYLIGWGLWEMTSAFFFSHVPGFSPEVFEKVATLYQEWDFWAVFVAGLTPITYKVFTIAGGVFGINLPVFIVASLLSRGLRFGVVGYLIYHFGPPVSRFIDRYFNILSIAFVVLLLGGFVLIKYVL